MQSKGLGSWFGKMGFPARRGDRGEFAVARREARDIGARRAVHRQRGKTRELCGEEKSRFLAMHPPLLSRWETLEQAQGRARKRKTAGRAAQENEKQQETP